MDTLSALDPLAWQPEYLPLHPAYQAGNALGWLSRGNKQASTNAPLTGRLYVSKSGWLLLSVPNALVRGVYDAMNAPGAELPTAGAMNVPNVAEDVVNAHISVMTADEVRNIGHNKINERGHMFGYSLGALKEITPKNVAGVSKIWAIQVSSPQLSDIRKSYGLSPLPGGDHAFHITVACRRKGVLLNNSTGKGGGEAVQEHSRGELKAASDTRVTYDCCCSGPCMCPETCTCKQNGRCGVAHKAAAAKASAPARSGTKLSRAGQKDLLPGGKADNVPDREISQKALVEGVQHEHEHTNNDQVAKEIAKDHLSEDPAYYKKVREIEKAARPRIIEELLEAKNHSDNKRYGHKSQILRKLMAQAPQDWVIDDSAPKFQGITHTPTKFRFHTDRTAIPTGVKAANTGSVYGDQLKNMMSLRQPLVYDHNKPVFENVTNHLAEVKRRGDFMLQAKRNHQQYRAAVDPKYRYQLAMQAFNGQMDQPAVMDQIIERHGNQLLNMTGVPR
jgi:hypothetical protein